MLGTAFINAKVRGMRSRLFESERLLGLCEVRHLTDLLHRLLPHKAVGSTLALERELLREHVHDLERIRRYLAGGPLELFSWLMRRYQLQNLKVIFRHFMAGATPEETRMLLTPTPEWLELPVEELLKSRDVPTFLTRVPWEKLRERAFLAASEEDGLDIAFRVELALDAAYFTHLKALAAQAGPMARRLIELDLAGNSLMAVLRAKEGYGIAFPLLSRFLVIVPNLLPERALVVAHGAGDIASVLKAIPTSFLRMEARQRIANIADLELVLHSELYRAANRTYYRAILDMAVVIAYYYIKRTELANLIRLAESVRFGLSREEIEARLVLLPRAPAEAGSAR